MIVDYVDLKIKGSIAEIWLNKPEKNNAFTDLSLNELNKALEIIEGDESVKILLLRGRGKSFCSGADVNWMSEKGKGDLDENIKDSKLLAKLLYKLYTIGKITIAIAHGKIYGGGIGLLSVCDIVIAEPNTKFLFSEVRLGLIPATIVPYILQRMGKQPTKYAMLAAMEFDVQQAMKLHLVDVLLGTDRKEEEIDIFLSKLLQNNYEAMLELKNFLQNENLAKPGTHWIDITAIKLAEIRSKDFAIAGMNSFLERKLHN